MGNNHLVILDPNKTIFKMLAAAKWQKKTIKGDISIMQLLIALHIDLMATNNGLPFLPSDFAITFSLLHYELLLNTQ